MSKRCFIAINLPENVRAELGKSLLLCKKINSQPVVRYVKTKGIHLTLHFLGYLAEERIEQVKKILKKLAKNYQKTELITGQIDAFPNLKRPRVIFLSNREADQDTLTNLQKDLGQELEKIGLTIDHRKWQPHLTLARIVGPCEFKTENLIIPKLKIPVNSIELMESQLLGSGAEYKILASYKLK